MDGITATLKQVARNGAMNLSLIKLLEITSSLFQDSKFIKQIRWP